MGGEDNSVTSDTLASSLVPALLNSHSPDPACADTAEGSLQDLRQPDIDAAVAGAAACPHVGFCGLSSCRALHSAVKAAVLSIGRLI